MTKTPLSRSQAIALWVFLGLGVFARVWRYALNFPLWGDEAFLAANFLPSVSHAPLDPLGWGPVAPPAFVALENAAVAVFGFSEASLRLLPTLAGVLGLFVFARVAALALSGWPRVLAVATLCASYYPTRHGAEVKPYTLDLLVASLLLLLALEWLRTPSRRRYGWGLALALPVAVWCSFPAAFVGGGLLLALLPRALRGEGRAPFVVGAVSLLASFAALHQLVIGAQMSHESYLFEMWAHTFPPWGEPLRLPLWFLEMNSGRMMAFPIGGKSGSSALTLLLVGLGALSLWRSRQRLLLGLLLAPFAVNLVAAGLQAYPYGGSARWMLHLAPAICLLFAVGVAWIARASTTERASAAVLSILAVLALIATATSVRACVKPYKNEHDRTARAVARWYWSDRGDGAVHLELCTDLGWNLFPTFPEGAPAQYLCNLSIVRGEPPEREAALRRLRDGAILRVTYCHPAGHHHDLLACAAWSRRVELESGFDEISREQTLLPRRRGGELVRFERIETLEYRARDPSQVSWPGR